MRNGGTSVLGAGSTVTLDQIDTGSSSTGLFYRSGAAITDLAPADQSFVISVADTGAGTCNNTTPETAACTVMIDVQARTDGPTGTVGAAMLTGFLDSDRTRTGGTLTSDDALDVPWADLPITATILNFTDTVTGDVGEVPLFYRLVSQPAGNVGLLKRGTTPLTGPTDADVITETATFTHAEVTAGTIFYENREIGGDDHVFMLDVSDGLFTQRIALTINRVLGFESDVGWVIDAVWDDAEAYTDSFACGLPADRGCRQCHWRNDADTSQRGCAVTTSTRTTNWTNGVNGVAGGEIKCDNLATRFPSGVLPDRPTEAGHPGGIVIQPGSFPHQVLQVWNGDTNECSN